MTPDQLQQRLTAFGSKLSPELQVEYRSLLDNFAQLVYQLGEIYKLASIDLLPSKTQPIHAPANTIPQYIPTKKSDKGDPLSELLHNLSETDKAKLVSGLEKKLGSQ